MDIAIKSSPVDKSNEDMGFISIKGLSRVSKLRDMFQTGVIRPIDEIDLDSCTNTVEEDNFVAPVNHIRTFPGSPPLSALRNLRLNGLSTAAKPNAGVEPKRNGIHSPNLVRTKLIKDVTVGGHSPTIPPIRPPKPKNLSLKRTPMPSANGKLKQSIAIFENGALVDSRPNIAMTKSTPNLTVPTQHIEQASSADNLSSHHVSPTAINSPPQSSEHVIIEHSSSASLISPSALSPDSVGVQGVTEQVESTALCATSPKSKTSSAPSSPLTVGNNPDGGDLKNCQDLAESANGDASDSNKKVASGTDCAPSDGTTSRVPDAEQNINETPLSCVPGAEVQDFIVSSDAFHQSPNHTSCDSADSLTQPELKYAEPIQVATPDEEGYDRVGIPGKLLSDAIPLIIDSCATGSSHQLLNPTIALPSYIHVVAVEDNGVHIFDDGNFCYSVPGLESSSNSLDDVNFQLPQSYDSNLLPSAIDQEPAVMPTDAGLLVKEIGSPLQDKHVRSTPTPNDHPTNNSSDSTIVDRDADSLLGQHNHRVRFSTEPIVVFSTHSVLEYDRRNEEVDPLGASAEYELEKQLEEMELINVDLMKEPDGLGISILGMGVDCATGEQKLGIFIKALTPGGAAEANGRIMVYDQIVEVDGTSLVGVSQKFAAQTLSNTTNIVRFVLAREADPSNSRIARLLAEQQECQERMTNVRSNRAGPATASGNMYDSPLTDYSPEFMDERFVDGREVQSDTDDDSHFDQNQRQYTEDDITEDNYLDFDDGVGHFANTVRSLKATWYGRQIKDDDDSSIVGSISTTGSNTPRSALKGTATAASTIRRHDAVLQLIRLAERYVEDLNGPDITAQDVESMGTHSIPSTKTEKLVWILGTELYDCRSLISKLKTHVQLLEQRLTAQEAAADEAIERLSFQRQHAEMELSRTQDQLAYLQQNSQELNGIPTANDPLRESYLPNQEGHGWTEQNSRVPSSGNFSGALPVDSSASMVGLTHGEFFQYATDPFQPAGGVQSIGPYFNPPCASSSPNLNRHSVDLDQVEFIKTESALEHLLSSNHASVPMTTTLPSHLRHAWERTRVVRSGLLSHRRPPTTKSLGSFRSFLQSDAWQDIVLFHQTSHQESIVPDGSPESSLSKNNIEKSTEYGSPHSSPFSQQMNHPVPPTTFLFRQSRRSSDVCSPNSPHKRHESSTPTLSPSVPQSHSPLPISPQVRSPTSLATSPTAKRSPVLSGVRLPGLADPNLLLGQRVLKQHQSSLLSDCSDSVNGHSSPVSTNRVKSTPSPSSVASNAQSNNKT